MFCNIFSTHETLVQFKSFPYLIIIFCYRCLEWEGKMWDDIQKWLCKIFWPSNLFCFFIFDNCCEKILLTVTPIFFLPTVKIFTSNSCILLLHETIVKTYKGTRMKKVKMAENRSQQSIVKVLAISRNISEILKVSSDLRISTDTKLENSHSSITRHADSFGWTFAVLISFCTLPCLWFKFQEWLHFGWSRTRSVPWNFDRIYEMLLLQITTSLAITLTLLEAMLLQ